MIINRIARIALLVAVLAVVSACGENTPPPPKTYPVKGKIVFLDGGSPSSGTIEFRSTSEPFTALGQVQPDGTFILATLGSSKKLEGAVEGEHTVTFISGAGNEQGQSTLTPSIAPEKYKVKAGDNDITVKVAKPRSPS